MSANPVVANECRISTKAARGAMHEMKGAFAQNALAKTGIARWIGIVRDAIIAG
jgi:hypothetical protein